MRITLLFVLILMMLVAVFCVQNAGVITVRFLTWHFEWSQALIILLAAFAGVLVGLMVSAVAGARKSPKPSDPSPKA